MFIMETTLPSGFSFNSFPDSSSVDATAYSNLILYFQFLSGFQLQSFSGVRWKKMKKLSIPFRIPARPSDARISDLP